MNMVIKVGQHHQTICPEVESCFHNTPVLITGGLCFIGSNLAHRLIDLGSILVPIEIKSGTTINKDFFNGFNYRQNLTETKVKSRAALIYGGNNSVIRNKIHVYAWWNFSDQTGLKG